MLRLNKNGKQKSRSDESLEARVGIEPTHKGFADLSLTTWVPRPCSCEQRSETEPVRLWSTSQLEAKKLERETGFEPATSTLARSHSTTELLPLSLTIVKRGWGSRNWPSLRKLQLLLLRDFAAIGTSVLGASHVWLAHTAQREYQRCKQYRGKPNPHKFALNDGESSWGKKTRDGDW